MSCTDIATYFDLSTFSHREIFDDCEAVWQVLPLIENYLSSLPLGIIEVDIPKGVHLVNSDKISIGKGSVVEPGSYIAGPCVIGEGSQVRCGAYIRGNFICGKKCVIGHATEVKGSLFLNNAHAAHFAYVGDTLLGNNTNLGAGTKCANLRFDNRAVSVYIEGVRYETLLRKFGAVFGDFSQSGCNSVTSPGTLIGKRGAIYPCTHAKGFIPANHCFRENGTIVEL